MLTDFDFSAELDREPVGLLYNWGDVVDGGRGGQRQVMLRREGIG